MPIKQFAKNASQHVIIQTSDKNLTLPFNMINPSAHISVSNVLKQIINQQVIHKNFSYLVFAKNERQKVWS